MGVPDQRQIAFCDSIFDAHPHQHSRRLGSLCGRCQSMHRRARAKEPGGDTLLREPGSHGVERKDVFFMRSSSEEDWTISWKFWKV